MADYLILSSASTQCEYGDVRPMHLLYRLMTATKILLPSVSKKNHVLAVVIMLIVLAQTGKFLHLKFFVSALIGEKM